MLRPMQEISTRGEIIQSHTEVCPGDVTHIEEPGVSMFGLTPTQEEERFREACKNSRARSIAPVVIDLARLDARTPEQRERSRCVAGELVEQFEAFRSGEAEHFIKTFIFRDAGHVELHHDFTEMLGIQDAFDPSFQDIEDFGHQKIIKSYSDVVLLRKGILDAYDLPHSINYSAKRFGDS